VPTASPTEAAAGSAPSETPASCSSTAPQQSLVSARGQPAMVILRPAAGAASSRPSVPTSGPEAPDVAALRRLQTVRSNGSLAGPGVQTPAERNSRPPSIVVPSAVVRDANVNSPTQSDVSDWSVSPKKKVVAEGAGQASHSVKLRPAPPPLRTAPPAEAVEAQKPAVATPTAAENAMRRLQLERLQSFGRASAASASSPSRPSVTTTARGAGARDRSLSGQSDVSEWSPTSPKRKKSISAAPAQETAVVQSLSSAALPRPSSPRQPHSPGRQFGLAERQALLQAAPPPRPARPLSATRVAITATVTASPCSSQASTSGAIHATPVRAAVTTAVEAVSTPRLGEATLVRGPPARSVSRTAMRQSHARDTTPVRSGMPQGLETPQQLKTPQLSTGQWLGTPQRSASSTPPQRSVTPPRTVVPPPQRSVTPPPQRSVTPPPQRSVTPPRRPVTPVRAATPQLLSPSPSPIRVMSQPVQGSDDSPPSLPYRAQSSQLDDRGMEAQMRRKSIKANADRLCQEALSQFGPEMDFSDGSEAMDIEREVTDDESEATDDEREAVAQDREAADTEQREASDDESDCASCCSFETGKSELTTREYDSSNSPNRRRLWSSSGPPPRIMVGGAVLASPCGGAFNKSDLGLPLGLQRRLPSRTPSCDGQTWHTGRDPFAAELKAEVRRRSLSRGSVRTPVRGASTIHQMDLGLTPVAEPGETPGRPGPTPGRMPRSASRPPSSTRSMERCAASPDAEAALLRSSQKLRPEATYDTLGRSSPRRLWP